MRAYISKYAELVKPLHALVNLKNSQMNDDPAARPAWTALMSAVTAQIVLCHLGYNEKILVRFDASMIGINATLLNGVHREHPLACIHRG